MPTSALTSIPQTYPELLSAVRRVLIGGQREIDRVWVHSYHETGRLITEHILLFKDRADYGTKTYHTLARDTGGSERRLYQCAQFYRCFPILQPTAKLTWTHYTTLCQVEDPPQRLALARQAERQGWVVDELEARVRAINATIELPPREVTRPTGSGPAAAKLLTPKRGLIGRYRVIADDEGDLVVDVGFKLSIPLSAAKARSRTAAQIVDVDTDGSLSAVDGGKPADLFTYAVKVRRVIDGDTLEIVLALPHLTARLKLRLRGLDCPEITTPEGKVAKRAVETLVRDAKSVTVYTSQADKYDRYLADVFLAMSDGTEIFLNNYLLENGLAERKDAWAFADWQKVEQRWPLRNPIR